MRGCKFRGQKGDIKADLPLPEKSFYARSNISSRERLMEEIFIPSVVPNTKSAGLAA